MDGFTFIHSGDLHLGKRFGLLPEEARTGPVQARADLPERLAAVAREAGAGHVLLAGDTFDSETPTRAVLRQAMTAMAAAEDLTWWILPGNHDSLAAEALWENAAPAGNVRILAQAAPVELARRVVLLPAPVPSRFPAADPTAWMADAATPEGAVRIGLAHGGIVDFSAPGDGRADGASGTIAPDRAALAGLSYLALGDWHAARAVGPRTWYAGTPEPDGFRHGEPGRCLAVTLPGPGGGADALPRVRECETGRYLWRAPELAVTPRDDPEALLRAALPSAPPDWRRTLVRARAAGRCALPAREALRAAADGLAAEFCHFEIDLRELRVEVAPEDIDTIAQGGRPAPRRSGAAGRSGRRHRRSPRPGGRLGRARPPLRPGAGDVRVKLCAIRLQNVRRFVDPVRIDGIAPGLNVLAAPNEYGKSTIFEAIETLFARPARAWDQRVRSLVPHAGGDPQVTVDVATEAGRFTVEKTWTRSRKGRARILREGRVLHQADDAEAWIAAALARPEDGGPGALLWVRQGRTALEDDAAAQAARRDLVSSVTGEVAEMTGGRRMEALRSTVAAELAAYVTATGRPRAGGALRAAEEAAERLATYVAELRGKVEALRAEIATRARTRREYAELTAPEAVGARADRLSAAEAAERAARAHAAQQTAAGAAAETARQRCAATRAKLDALDGARAEHAASRRALEEAEAAVDAAAQSEQAERAALEAASAEAAEAVRVEEAAIAVAARARQADAAAAAAERRRVLAARCARAETVARRAARAQAAARSGPDRETLDALEAASLAVRLARHAREAAAPSVTVHYAPGAAGSVRLGGAALPGEAGRALPEGGRLEIAGIGTLLVHPGSGADGAEVAAAEHALAEALAEAGQPDMDAARTAANRAAATRQESATAKAELDGIAPEGLDALRTELAALPETDSAEPPQDAPVDRARAEADEQRARAARAAAAAALERRRTALAAAQAATAAATAGREAAAARLERARAALEMHGDAEAQRAHLAAALTGQDAALRAAEAEAARLAAAAPDGAAAAAALERARRVVANAETRAGELAASLAAADARIEVIAGEAVEEELGAARAELEAARARAEALRFEVAVLQRVAGALDAAREAARERYLAPVLGEVKPLLAMLWPEAELAIDADTLLPVALERPGARDRHDQLSGGTQEQIALLVRLAFARLMAREGRHAPVILDDGLVFTDDARIETMFDILTRQAETTQIVVLTCRERLARDLGGTVLRIVPDTG